MLVTGGSGYLGSHLIARLLQDGRAVRTTVRSLEREAELRTATHGSATELEVVGADLLSDDGWAAAMDGCDEVHHVASPIAVADPEDPDDLIVPAREGTLRVLRAARAAGARRVVLTSSFAAVGYTPKPGADFTEDDWTDPDTPGLATYPRSKAIAERAAWDLLKDGTTELVAINPTAIFGPLLSRDTGASVALIQRMLNGTMTVVPRRYFGIADVRDVADLHVRAMAEPTAAGKRFLAVSNDPTLNLLQIAEILGRRPGAQVPTEEAAGPTPPRPTIHNTRARAELGWDPRPAETTLVDTAESLEAFGLI
ncbi:NAD-dependent epimerase/dehydratase family protein [Kribbella sp. NPDC055071]